MVKDLTVGNPSRVLWKYTVPMFIGVAFQQLYNIADSVIVGRYAGEAALAAVGASYPVTMLLMALAIGSQMGCSVVVSRLFGAKDYTSMKAAVSTSMLAGLAVSLTTCLLGLAASGSLMRMLQTPENIFDDGALYLRIYIGGFIFLFLYNVATGIFNSLGDSRTPLYFLMASSVGNAALDFVFVAFCGWGVQGVAWATFIAQGAACVLSLLVLNKRLKGMGTGKCVLFEKRILAKVGSIAVPSILQQSFISVGNLIIQILINGYGSSVIAGYSAAIKLNTFAITSLTTLGNGVSGFTAQNIGAGKKERVGSGCRAGMRIASGVAACFFALFFSGGDALLGLFMNREATLLAKSTGREFLCIVAPFYPVICIKLVCDGVLRGSGSMKLFMAATLTDLVLRVVLAFAFSAFWGARGIWASWPMGWGIAMGLSLWFYVGGKWDRDRPRG